MSRHLVNTSLSQNDSISNHFKIDRKPSTTKYQHTGFGGSWPGGPAPPAIISRSPVRQTGLSLGRFVLHCAGGILPSAPKGFQTTKSERESVRTSFSHPRPFSPPNRSTQSQPPNFPTPTCRIVLVASTVFSLLLFIFGGAMILSIGVF